MGQVLGSCERLVHARLFDHAARKLQARLIATQLGAPFFLSALAGPAALGAWGANPALAVAAAIFAVSLTNVVLAASGRHARLAGSVALVHALGVAGFALWMGAPSPLVLLLALAMIGETAWVSGGRKAAMTSAVLALPVVAATFVAQGEGGTIAAITGAAAAVAYLGVCAARLTTSGTAQRADDPPSQDTLDARMDAVILQMTREGEVVSASHQTQRILGVEPDFLIGAAFFQRVRVTDRVKLLCALSSEGAAPQHVRMTVRVPGEHAGQVAHLDVALELIRGADDWTVILRDASDMAALEGALDDANEQASALEVAKSRFLAAVSHELRTPLNAIIGFSDMLLHEAVSGPLPAKQAEHVGLIREAGNHLLAVVNSILDISKIEAGAYSIHPEPFALKNAINLTLSLLESQAGEKGVSLAVTAKDGWGELDADQRAVHQILLNLVSNAIKFTPQGGRVTVSVQRDADRVALVVADTGIGIAADDLAGLGKPFTQVQNDYTRKFEGTGLGLSLVKGLVALHDGELSIESAPGEGTTVTVSFPAARGSAAVTMIAKTQISNGNGQGAHGTFRKIA